MRKVSTILTIDNGYEPISSKQVVIRELNKGTLKIVGEKWQNKYNEFDVLFEEPQEIEKYLHIIKFQANEKVMRKVIKNSNKQLENVSFLERCLTREVKGV